MSNKELQVPLLAKDVTLMSPGNWNGWNYSADELEKAFSSRDYNSEEINLFLDHPENPNNAAGAWIGRVKNLRQLTDSTIKGDLEIYDQDTIYKLQIGKAKFGVSPRLLGKENKQDMSFTDIFFDNWSIVSKPAQSTAMINLSSNLGFDGLSIQTLSLDDKDSLIQKGKGELKSLIKNLSEKYHLDNEQIKEITKEEIHNLSDEELLKHDYPIKGKNKKNLKGGQRKEMSEEEKNEVVEESDEESKEEVSEELSDADVLNIISKDMDGFNAFKRENPNLNMKELAIEFKKRNERLGFIEELSENEATVMLRKLLDKVGTKELSIPASKELSADNSMVRELSRQLENLHKEIKELKKVDKVPSPKSVRNLNAPIDEGFSMIRDRDSEGVKELAQEIFSMIR